MMTPSDYRSLFEKCQLTNEAKRLKELESVCRIILNNQVLYQTVSRFVSVPWPLIGAIHSRESSLNFTRHLHNGDPLAFRTTNVPEGRPALGTPPFTWVESAIDALEGAWLPMAWDVPGCLEFLERYNGLGYQKRGVSSPYVWNYTDRYVCGLYVADGKFDPLKVEARPGCVAILKTLEKKGVTLEFTALPARDSALH